MELIDRDNLFELFKDNQYFRTRTVATIAAKNVIDSAPTIDAEPVVRCGECKYRRTHDKLYCGFDNLPKHENDYCSYGEREGGAE